MRTLGCVLVDHAAVYHQVMDPNIDMPSWRISSRTLSSCSRGRLLGLAKYTWNDALNRRAQGPIQNNSNRRRNSDTASGDLVLSSDRLEGVIYAESDYRTQVESEALDYIVENGRQRDKMLS